MSFPASEPVRAKGSNTGVIIAIAAVGVLIALVLAVVGVAVVNHKPAAAPAGISDNPSGSSFYQGLMSSAWNQQTPSDQASICSLWRVNQQAVVDQFRAVAPEVPVSEVYTFFGTVC